MPLADPEDASRDKRGRFVNGSRPGPGRPKGSRNRYAAQVFDDLYADWIEGGVEAIKKVRERSPEVYLRVATSVMPREVMVQALTVNATIDPGSVAEARQFLAAYRLVRDEAPVIEAEPIEDVPEGVVVSDGWDADDD